MNAALNGDLHPHHAARIKDSAIAPEVAQARGYRSVTTQADAERLGFSPRQRRVPALLIPVWNAAGELATYQLRPDEPRANANGKPIKYETPGGGRMVLDVPPPSRPWLGDPARPLFVTEGVRKADSAVSRGLCCVALLGVWNWRGTNEHGGKTALPDWEYVALDRRAVYVAFDSDVMDKPAVHAALVRLGAFLAQRKADVRYVYLLPGSGGAKVGLDDYFAAGGDVAGLLALATPELRGGAEPDAPAHAYRATPRGLVWDRATQHGPVEELLTNFTARIVADVIEDDGAETRRTFEVEARLNGRTSAFAVPAERFAAMGWPMEHLGPTAVVFPGLTTKEHARAAIQLLSGETVPQRRIYAHLGWRDIEGEWVYLHAGGAVGARGPASNVEVRPPDALRAFVLPEPPSGGDLRTAIRASLRMLNVAPDPIAFPLFAAVWRAVLAPADFGLHLAGQTGEGKTELVALIQQHWGAGLDARHLPGAWSATGNALEGLTFAAKDAVVVVDDFAPAGTSADVARLHREADRLLRAQGNNAGRLRMRADASLRPAKPPRGLILSTGEDVPRGHSLRGRLLILEAAPGMVNWSALTACQRDAAAGLYAQALAGFVAHLAPTHGDAARHLRAQVETWRADASRANGHRRTPEIVANLAAGLKAFLRFAHAASALERDEAERLFARGWSALSEAAAAQGQHQTASEPTRQFLALLSAAVAGGDAHLAGRDGGEPHDPKAWGWRPVSFGAGVYERPEWRPLGRLIGWLDGADLYLEPEQSYAVANELARKGGDAIPVSAQTLRKRLRERGFLASTDHARETTTVRRVLQGAQRGVLHLRRDALSPCAEPDNPDIWGAAAEPSSGFGEPPSGGVSGSGGQPDAENWRNSTDSCPNVGFVGSDAGGMTTAVPEGGEPPPASADGENPTAKPTPRPANPPLGCVDCGEPLPSHRTYRCAACTAVAA